MSISMKTSTEIIITLIAVICLTSCSIFIGVTYQFNKDAELLSLYKDNGTIPARVCIPCECISPDPYREKIKFEEPPALIVGKMQGPVTTK